MLSRYLQIAIAGILVALLATYLYFSSTQPVVEYYIDMPQTKIYIQNENYFKIQYKNTGGFNGLVTFNLQFTNITLSTSLQHKEYNVSNSYKEEYYLLGNVGSGGRIFYFIVNKNASGFSIEFTAEKNSMFDSERLSPINPVKITYKWSNQTKSYELIS